VAGKKLPPQLCWAASGEPVLPSLAAFFNAPASWSIKSAQNRCYASLRQRSNEKNLYTHGN
jgi:hypothetical protein